MTPTQIKYLSGRLNEIKRARWSAIRRYPTSEQYDEWYKNGNYEVQKGPTSTAGYSLIWTKLDEWTEEYTKKTAHIDKEYHQVMDKIMLGDVEEALAMIRKFEEEV